MYKQRRRRAKFAWFPTLGTQVTGQGDDPNFNLSGREFNITVAPGSGATPVTVVSPLTLDTPLEPEDVNNDAPGILVGQMGQEYFIRRIVGKFFVTRSADQGGNSGVQFDHPGVLVGAGMFVARAGDEADVPGNAQLPLGGATASGRWNNFGVLNSDTIREPWLWRRTWLLGKLDAVLAKEIANNVETPTLGVFVENGAGYPMSSSHYGSVQDGPHVDAKTARRVGGDDRLFLAITATPMPSLSSASSSTGVSGYFDLRILAQLRRPLNKGKF